VLVPLDIEQSIPNTLMRVIDREHYDQETR